MQLFAFEKTHSIIAYLGNSVNQSFYTQDQIQLHGNIDKFDNTKEFPKALELVRNRECRTYRLRFA